MLNVLIYIADISASRTLDILMNKFWKKYQNMCQIDATIQGFQFSENLWISV